MNRRKREYQYLQWDYPTSNLQTSQIFTLMHNLEQRNNRFLDLRGEEILFAKRNPDIYSENPIKNDSMKQEIINKIQTGLKSQSTTEFLNSCHLILSTLRDITVFDLNSISTRLRAAANNEKDIHEMLLIVSYFCTYLGTRRQSFA